MAHSQIYSYLDRTNSINSFALSKAYQSMANRGLGLLVLTWTTVVLLGGFVSALHKKDFWCLTFITLVQMAGLYGELNGPISYIVNAVRSLLSAPFFLIRGDSFFERASSLGILLVIINTLVQAVMLLAVLCPIVIIYSFGILISGGISLWRLIEHDYSDSDGEASNLPPAMDTLYYLVLLQFVVLCYRLNMLYVERRLVKLVASKYGEEHWRVVSNYLQETTRECVKDPSFLKRRNLITHAVDLISSNSPADCISGVNVLYTALCISEMEFDEVIEGHRMLMKHLILSAPSSCTLHKLLETLDSKGIHHKETRMQGAAIVDLLALEINLEQFPQGIQHISSLIDTFVECSIAEPYLRDYLYNKYDLWKDYKVLLLRGMSILRKLAVSENNCKVIRETPNLVLKIMIPVTSDLLHHTLDDHGAWSDIVAGSMRVMRQLTGAPGKVGAELRHELTSCEGAINTLWRILNCDNCNDELKICTIQILAEIYKDRESSRAAVLKNECSSGGSNISREDFVRKLMDIFTEHKKSISIRKCSGIALSEICFHGGGSSDAPIAIQTCGGDGVVDSLIKVVVHEKNEICRQAAAEILDHLCTHYNYSSSPSTHVLPSNPAPVPSVCASITTTPQLISPSPSSKDDDFGKIKLATLKVLGEILCCVDETNEAKEADPDRFAKLKTDIESQCDNGRGKGINSSSPHLQKNEQDKEERESDTSAILLSSLLSLFGTVYDTKSIIGLPPHLDASIFLNMLKGVVVKKTNQHTVENLLLFKAIAKMVILMMKHSGNWSVKKEDIESLLEELCLAWQEILNLDYSMIFRSFDSSSAIASSKLNRCTLASLLKEAQQLHDNMPSTSASCKI